jgi:hypothetical protein
MLMLLACVVFFRRGGKAAVASISLAVLTDHSVIPLALASFRAPSLLSLFFSWLASVSPFHLALV